MTKKQISQSDEFALKAEFQRVADKVAAGMPGHGSLEIHDVLTLCSGVDEARENARPCSGVNEARESASWCPGTVVRFSLDNGLQVLYMPDHGAPLVSFQSWFRAGTVNESGFRNGIAHLLEHMMFKGTRRYPHRDLDRLLEEAGAQNNAATWLDWTFYYESLPSASLELAFDLESDRMTGIVLDSENLEPEREVVRSERRYRVDNDPDGEIEEALFAMLFPGHPYGTPTLGTLAEIDAITVEDCLAFYHRFYQPSNAVLSIAGDCEFERLAGLCLSRYGAMSGSPVPRQVVPPFRDPVYKTVSLKLDVNSERLRIGWVTVPAGHPDAIALDVVNEILFSNESSRVYRRLIEDDEIASDVDGTSEPMRLAGTFIVDVTINEGEKAEDASEAVFDEIRRLVSKGPTPGEMKRACNHLEASFLRSMVTSGSRATQLGIWHVTTGDFRDLFSFVAEVRSVDAESVVRAASRYLVPERAVTVVASPIDPGHGEPCGVKDGE